MILRNKLPAWNIPDVNLKSLKSVQCLDRFQCRNVPLIPSHLVSDFDGISDSRGNKFNVSCNLGRSGMIVSIS